MSVDFWGKSEDLPWPKLENGEPEPPALLHETGDRDEFQSIMMMLKGYGIPALDKTPGDRHFTTVLFGSELIGGSIYVPESVLEDAKVLLTTPLEELADEDMEALGGEEELSEGEE